MPLSQLSNYDISKKRLIKAEGNKSLIDDKSNFVTQINELESLKKDGMEKKKGKNRDKKKKKKIVEGSQHRSAGSTLE